MQKTVSDVGTVLNWMNGTQLLIQNDDARCYYFDTTVRHSLGRDHADHGYWKAVTAHEVAHQWWGHTVGFASGRDQWMSEGFADMSAALYIGIIDKNPKKFIEFWNDEREEEFGG